MTMKGLIVFVFVGAALRPMPITAEESPRDLLESARKAAQEAAPVPSSFSVPAPLELKLPDGQIVPVVDRRAWASERTIINHLSDPEFTEESHRMFFQATVNRARRHGVDVESNPTLNLMAILAERENVPESNPPVPGGVGFGITYHNNDLLSRV